MLIAIDRMANKHLQNKTIFQACRIQCTFKRGIASSSNVPVLRFAPSPTGQLHLGGLRTALFNHLFARSLGGRWILRIEDTDRNRLVPGAVESMQDILKWAGLDYDEGPDKICNRGPYVQSERLDLYKAYSDKLLQSGHAYRDFREPSKNALPDIAGDVYLPPGEEEAQEMIEKGKSFVIRFKTKEGDTSFDDAVYGHLKFPYDRRLEDPIIVKSDGWPTYHLANVIDDKEMGITHVFRGEEWLPSMPIHLNLYDALGTSPPQFVHLPLLINPDGSKLSKRHADVHVESYRKEGYEPEALVNFVALMGFNWHLPDSRSEVFSMEEMIAQFKLDRISQSRASPDVSKLRFLNKSHFTAKIEGANESEKVKMLSELKELVKQKDPNCSPFTEERSSVILEAIVKRSINLNEAADEVVALYTPVSYEKEATEEVDKLDAQSRSIAISVAQTYFIQSNQSDFQTDSPVSSILKEAAKHFEKQAKNEIPNIDKKLRGRATFFKMLRFALTGKLAGPTLVELMMLLGKEECIDRIKRAKDWNSEQ
ncbi:hypothetical protein L7F22_054026 [Adiantum nelumboides]|nr:hypothetical protein [Adiantum nelumboides]